MNTETLKGLITEIIKHEIVLHKDDCPVRFAPEYAASQIVDLIDVQARLEENKRLWKTLQIIQKVYPKEINELVDALIDISKTKQS